MTKLSSNPFKFGDPVEGAYYLPRPELTKTVCQFLENRIHVVLIGPRRFGKTSFVLHLLKTLEKRGYNTIFVDIFNITSHKDFLQQLLRAHEDRKGIKEHIKQTFKNLRPSFSAELKSGSNSSSLGIGLTYVSEKDIKEAIQDALAHLGKLGKQVVVCIDEFQKISEIEDQGWLEATLRTHMQSLKNTSFILTGSRKSLIADMLNNPSRPLFRSCQPIEFPSFGDEFTTWVIKRFEEVGIVCERAAINHLRELVQETPNYVQMVCFHLVALGVEHVTRESVENALITVVRQNAFAYQTLLNSLTATQQRALRLAAKEEKQLFSKELLVQYEISSGPALASALRALKAKGILDESNSSRGKVIFDDPLFAIWLKTCFDP